MFVNLYLYDKLKGQRDINYFMFPHNKVTLVNN